MPPAELAPTVSRPGREVTGIYYDWARASEVEEDGVLLVRPDKAHRLALVTMPEDPEQALENALSK